MDAFVGKWYQKRKTFTTTKPYPTKWGRLHGSNYAIVFKKRRGRPLILLIMMSYAD